jgi:hypothetical protein
MSRFARGTPAQQGAAWHDACVPAPRTPDGRWIVVGGRRWRAADPELPEPVRARLLHHLGTARSAVRTAKRADDDAALAAARARIGVAKHGSNAVASATRPDYGGTRKRRHHAAHSRRPFPRCGTAA